MIKKITNKLSDASFKKQSLMLLDAGFKQITELGSATLTAVIALGALFIYKELAIRIILGIAGVTLISYLIKIFFFKNRPKIQSTDTFIERVDASSFPSVHAARITVMVFWIMVLYNASLFSLFLLLIGLIVIYSRVYLKKHYWTDVIGGVIIAGVVNVLIYWILSRGTL